MACARVKSIHKYNFHVCRFCLQTKPDELKSLFENVNNESVMDDSTRSVLAMLEIKVTPSDAYPKLICINCHDTLISIYHFRENIQRSMNVLQKAKDMMEPLEVKLEVCMEDDVGQYEELISEVIIEEQIIEDSDRKVEAREEFEAATTMLSISGNSSVQNDLEPEDETEEAYLKNGFIPITDCKVEIIPKQKAPKTRKPAAQRVCPICGLRTSAMVVHMRTHSNDRPYECDLCDLKFYTGGKLRCHRDSVHIAERKFSCEVCGKAFVLKKNLKAHIMTHTNKRTHVCSYCPKSFLFRWSLTTHERTHTGERPYMCNWPDCNKSFVTVSNLIQHQKIANHSKDVALEICSLCLKAFQTQAALKAHQTKTHGAYALRDNVTSEPPGK